MVAIVPMSADGFVACVALAGPGLREVVEAHRGDFGETLLHVLCGDLSRYCIAAWERGGSVEVEQCLACATAALEQGDNLLREAIQASFVENVGPWDVAMRPFIATWPPALQTEAARQVDDR